MINRQTFTQEEEKRIHEFYIYLIKEKIDVLNKMSPEERKDFLDKMEVTEDELNDE